MAKKMTRQEQLNEAWCNYRGKCSTENLHALAFALRWCNEHQNWISVEDELPEKGDIVIVMQDAYGNIHFTACEFISAMQLCDVTDFHVRSDAYLGITKKAEITLGAVTHWMLVEPPAKLSNLERIGKNRKEKKGGEE